MHLPDCQLLHRPLHLLRNVVVALVVQSWLAATPASALQPALPELRGTYDITNYGALGDGVATNTPVLQSAIRAASAAGGETITFRRGSF